MASIRALECLVAVADCGSITEAARLLHLTQPAVSHQLAELERETRTPLFNRRPRGVSLTPAGNAAIPHARRTLEAAASAVLSARAVGDGTGGTLRVACAQSLTVPLVAPVLRDWHRRRPHVVVSLRESAVLAELLGFIDSGAVDIGLLPAPVPSGYVTSRIAEEEIVLTAPVDHRLARPGDVRLQELDGVALVHFAPDNGLRDWLDRSLAEAGVRPEPVMRTSITTAAPQLAAAGMGLSITPVSAVSAGLPASIRSFSPRWVRQLIAVTPAQPDPLSACFIADLRTRGVRVPRDVVRQLAGADRDAHP
ncbi:DNA-binding transcriptional regulator, LysR family [Nakamurella panacisegetis]|uniref:DNA-binding transcriptional regulator, LysR family n=1 Tax=Nakamurella panacisegetis TaxID=1090615 RepID=A0A1H0RBU2_9ACTN|nr:LysR family transcriptional regulator [Nakamurella panacisegetis]SDP26994.1 DNA-binding transcriptional regulator, LysR family [Nakamurella panacisegetis]